MAQTDCHRTNQRQEGRGRRGVRGELGQEQHNGADDNATTSVALLAIASLVHALVLSVGRNRRPLGVLKSLGFTRAQVGGTVACQANAFGLVALVTAVPLGVFLGRQVWALVAEQLGVPDVPQVPVASAAAVVLVGLLVVNLVASYPAWRAARLPTAVALRSE